MNKVIVATVVSLSAGIALGYIGGSSKEDEQKKTLSDKVLSEQRPPRFGESKSSPSLAKESAIASKTASRYKSLKEVFKESHPNKRMEAMLAYFDTLSVDQLEKEAKALKDLSFENRFMASYLLFSKWAETAPQQAMEYANKLGFRGMMEKSSIFQTWAATNPEGAAAYYNENKNILEGNMAGNIAGEWARTNPDAAIVWAESLSGRAKNDALSSILMKMAESDPAAAIQKLASFPADFAEGSGARVYSSLAQQMAKKDWAATEAWVATLPVDQQDWAKSSALSGLASVNPAEASRQVEKMEAGSAKDRAVGQIASSLAEQNPQAAAEWVLKNASEGGWGNAVGTVMNNWVYSDTSAAQKWVASLPEGASKDQAVMRYAMSTPSKDYEQTLTMAGNISNQGVRDTALSTATRNWMKDDPEAAKAWLEGTSLLSQDRKNALIESSDRGSRRGGMMPMRPMGGGGGGRRGR